MAGENEFDDLMAFLDANDQEMEKPSGPEKPDEFDFEAAMGALDIALEDDLVQQIESPNMATDEPKPELTEVEYTVEDLATPEPQTLEAVEIVQPQVQTAEVVEPEQPEVQEQEAEQEYYMDDVTKWHEVDQPVTRPGDVEMDAFTPEEQAQLDAYLNKGPSAEEQKFEGLQARANDLMTQVKDDPTNAAAAIQLSQVAMKLDDMATELTETQSNNALAGKVIDARDSVTDAFMPGKDGVQPHVPPESADPNNLFANARMLGDDAVKEAKQENAKANEFTADDKKAFQESKKDHFANKMKDIDDANKPKQEEPKQNKWAKFKENVKSNVNDAMSKVKEGKGFKALKGFGNKIKGKLGIDKNSNKQEGPSSQMDKLAATTQALDKGNQDIKGPDIKDATGGATQQKKGMFNLSQNKEKKSLKDLIKPKGKEQEAKQESKRGMKRK